MLAFGAALPPAAAAQNRAEREGQSITADIQELRRSPFHARISDRSVALQADRQLPAPPLYRHSSNPPDDEAPDPVNVFMVTLGATLAAHVGGFYMWACAIYGRDGNCGEKVRALALLGGVSIPVLVPPAAATLAGARFWPGVRGSLTGLLGAYMGTFVTSLITEDVMVNATAFITVHALVTSAAALHK